MNRAERLLRAFFPAIGLLCILFPDHVTAFLPYLLGGVMLASGGLRSAAYARERDASRLAYGLVLLVVGMMFLLQGQNALGAVGTVWAVIGIRKSAKSLDRAIHAMQARAPFLSSALAFALRMALALLLLFDPFEKFSAHVRILGFELLAISVRFTGKRFSLGEPGE